MEDSEDDTNLKYRIQLCFRVLKEYSWLLDSYILDFFTENHSQKLPNSWREHLQRISPEELGYLMDLTIHNQNHVWPLSFLSLRSLLKFVNIPRQPNNEKFGNLLVNRNGNQMNFSVNTKIGSNCLKHPKLKNLFLKHVKPKKRYEIYKIAETTAKIARELDVDYVVDVGSGLGHLSRIMCYGFNLNVCCLETQLSLLKQAEKLDLELELTASKHLSDEEMEKVKQKRPVHVNKTVSFHLDVDDFVQILKKAFNTYDNNFNFGIVGLHPCGDLTAILLNVFVQCSEARFITLVGCCYHKLSTPSESSNVIGFPLSKHCRLRYSDVSYEARALACHAIETYCNRLRSSDYDHLKIHCYRATLEKIIEKNWPRHRKCALNSVKHGPNLNFNEYCKSALKKLNLMVPVEDLESNEIKENLSRWKDVVVYYSLRLMLAPMIETLILLDRILYLKENGLSCKLTAAFDPTISPRNQILTAKKNSDIFIKLP